MTPRRLRLTCRFVMPSAGENSNTERPTQILLKSEAKKSQTSTTPTPQSAGIDPYSAIDQLCKSCGLCCNGVLFTDVKLDKDESHHRLVSLGLKLKKSGSTLKLCQPCPAHVGGLCSVYADRPQVCRKFECQLLRRVQAGTLQSARALEIIETTLAAQDDVQAAVAACGETREQVSLSRRFRNVMSQPLDLADPHQEKLRRKLAAASHRLGKLLREFV